MRKIDVSTYGVEMTSNEMRAVNGGWKWFGKNKMGENGWYFRTFLGVPYAVGKDF